jgi:maltose alpha-D-glucosyltransferase/alpha-amylase
MTTDWFRDAVIYELHVRAFADSNGDGIGDFDGLTSKLDYLADLGVTALWLLPFYPSPLRDAGYDIADYRVINTDYGTMRSFKRFLSAAHARNLKVITELVINHTSDQHHWFQRARAAPAGSRWRDFYVWSDDVDRYRDARVIFQDFETSNWTWDPVAGQYFWHRFYSHQPDLNFDNPEVEAAVLDVLDFWLDLGVDGLRLDAVPYLFEREGTNCENLPETHAFLKRLRAHMDERFEGKMLLAEANQWPEDAAAYFGDGDECHMNFHFPLMPRMFMSVQAETRMPIVDILEQTPPPPPGAQWATFLRNHDELTLEMVTDEERDLMLRAYARDSEMRVNLGIRRRLAPLLGNDRRKVELLNALLFSLPGTPVIYYGDEIGMGDNVYLGDRDGVRTPMQWSADRNAGFSTCNPHRLYLPLIPEVGYHYESANVESQLQSNTSLLSWMRQLIALRKRHPVLGRGDLRILDPDNPHILAFIRHMDGEQPFLCVANLSRLAQHVELDLRAYADNTPVEVFGRTRFARVRSNDSYHLTLAPHGFFWFVLEPAIALVDAEVALPHLPGTWSEVMRRKPALAKALVPWLPQRRWFSGKGRTVREIHVEDVLPIRDTEPEVALIIAVVGFAQGEDQRYAIPVLRATGQLAVSHLVPQSVIAKLDDGSLIDAMSVPAGAHAVASAALTRRSRQSTLGTVHGIPRRPGLLRLIGAPADVQMMNGDQSNSSVILGGGAMIAKLVRRLEAAPNPDAVIPEHLARFGFSHAAALLATLDVSLPGEDHPVTAVVVHNAIANEGDLWTWMRDELSREIDARSQRNTEDNRAHAGSSGGSTLFIAGLLGRRTAELHLALAHIEEPMTNGHSSFAPLPFTLLWQRSLLQSLRSSLRSTQRALKLNSGRVVHVDDGYDAMVTALCRPPDHVLARFEALRVEKVQASRIRVHGDMHLGQVLWTGHDVVFIDFEGEPARPLSERSLRRSPLVDVAGLIRSIDYAGRNATHTATERGVVAMADIDGLEQWRRSWTSAVQERLVVEYLAGVSGTGLVPADRPGVDLLLELFVLEKALYEIRYELASRPEWAAWPMKAAFEMIEGALVQ